MSENSKIEWTDHTFNPWWGCQKVSEGCKHCYAEVLDNRYNHEKPHWGPGSDRRPMSEAHWKQPIKWNAAAEKARKPAKVFCASMADVFEGHEKTYGYLERLFRLIQETPWLTWQLLTKRPENILNLIPREWQSDFPKNIITGTSVENQAETQRIAHLAKVPGPHFLSCAPLLGPLLLQGRFDAMSYNWLNDTGIGGKIDWVIVGGESGPGARPMHPDWVRSIRDQCESIGVPFLFKQWGEYCPGEKGRLYHERTLDFTDGQPMVKVGKKAAGRLLDGRTWDEFPLENGINSMH